MGSRAAASTLAERAKPSDLKLALTSFLDFNKRANGGRRVP
jgi:hypothetical protein